MNETLYTLRDTKQATAVALKAVRYEIKLAGICSEMVIRQSWRNDSQDSVEAVYVMPKDEGAVITEFTYDTEGRKVRTVVEEKDAAFEKYDEAIKNGDGAALLDYLTGDLLQISVGNLKPGQEIEFSIKLAQELRIVDDTVRFFVPLSRFPRYQSADSDPIQADVQNASIAGSVPYKMELALCWEKSFIKNCTSPTHRKWGMGEQGAGNFISIYLDEGMTGFSRDLEIHGELVNQHSHQAYLARHANGSGIIYASFNPVIENWKAQGGKDIVFFIDCSGSMGGTPIENAKKAVEICLRSMGEEDSFSFILFGSSYQVIRDEGNRSFDYTDKNFNNALKRIRSIDANMGGTELYSAVKDALAFAAKTEKPQEWVLLTDGGVSDPERVVKMVANARVRPRIFTFGIGNGASTSLLQGLSRVSGGSCEMVLDDSAIAESVLRQFARIDQPRCDGIGLSVDGQEYDLAEPLCPIYEGDSWSCIARVEPGCKTPENVELSLKVGGESFTYVAPLVDLGNWNPPGCLWASKKVRYLEEHADDSGSNQLRMSKKKTNKALELALEFQIVSSQTSFVGIEEREDNGKCIERPVYQMVPSLMSADRIMPPAAGGIVMACAPAPAVAGPFISRSRSVGVMPDRCCESEAMPFKKSAPAQEWYIELISAMSKDGYFDYDQTIKILKARIAEIDELVKQTAETYQINSGSKKIIATLIAIDALKDDPKACKVCRKSIEKATKWLKSQSVPEYQK